MHAIDFCGYGLFLIAPYDGGLQGDQADPEHPVFVFRHDAFCCTIIDLGDKAGGAGHMKEPEHVAAGDGGSEGLLGVDSRWI